MLPILGVQIIGVALALLVFYEARVLYKKGQFKRRDFIIWYALAGALIVVSLIPNIVIFALTVFTQVKRGLDAVLVLGLFLAYAMIFQIYIRIQQTNREVTELVRKVAIKLEESGKGKK